MPMTSPYAPVPRFHLERLTIAIFCGECLRLHWQDMAGGASHHARVRPLEVVVEEGGEYLLGEAEGLGPVRIRLDRIHNLPTPYKTNMPYK